MDRIRLLYTQTGRAIWISHLDMMRMLQRAMNRAGIAVRYSEGFNPHAQISILMPLSVGTESLCQLVDIRVREELDLATLPDRLNAVLPEGIRVLSAWEDGRKSAEIGWLRVRCRWEYENAPPAALPEALRELFARPALAVTRRTKRGEGAFDLIPYTQELSFAGEGKLVIAEGLVSAAEPVVRPELLHKAVEENAPELAPAFARCCRVELYDKNGAVFR